jgi:uncharacterized protein YecE (DUF72 family)
MISVGTAGWSIPRAAAEAFPGDGPHLARYARILHCAEINTSFYRAHSVETYARWAALTPTRFRFSVKLPRAITHEARLRRARAPLEAFLSEVAGLGTKLGPLLMQLPPSFEFEARPVRSFLELLRTRHAGPVVCEPRHKSWFEPAAEKLLAALHVSRVAADPTPIAAAQRPGGWAGGAGAPVYYRLHGAPRKYWSRYETARIAQWAQQMRALPPGTDVWCIFDNTAGGGAIENALELKALTAGSASARRAAMSAQAE